MSEPIYPKGEILWAGYYDRSGQLLFIVTSNPARDWYFLYALAGDKFKKLGKAREPPELIEKFHIQERMCST